MRRNQVLPVASRVEVAALGTPARTIAPPWCSRHYRSARWPLPPGVAALVWADRPTYGETAVPAGAAARDPGDPDRPVLAAAAVATAPSPAAWPGPGLLRSE